MNSLFMAIMISDSKVVTQIAMTGSRKQVKERANKHAQRFGYTNKVFAAHYERYGRIKLDFTMTKYSTPL